MSSIALIAHFIIMSLLTAWFPSCAMAVFLVTVFLIGIPHGALDLWILRKKFSVSSLKTMILFLAYLLLAIGSFLGFYWFSSYFFGFFLLYSAYHFGMDYYDSSLFQTKVYCYFFALFIGLSIICLPALLHAEKVSVLFSYLIGLEQAMFYTHVLHWAACFLLPVTFLGFITLKKDGAQEIIIVLMASFLAPPLAFLTVYFIGVHSCKYFAMLYKNIGYLSYGAFVKDLLPMTLLTYTFAITACFYFPSIMSQQGAGFFIALYMLAALTLPHLILVEVFKKK